MIEFYDDSGVIGTVRVADDGKLDASATMESIADAWIRRRRPPSDFETFYDGWSNGYVNARRVDDIATSDNGDMVSATNTGHTGAMIALVPRDTDAERLSVDGGEDPEQLHVTLAYLGEAALIPAEVRQELVDAVAALTQSMPTIVGDVFAVNMFNPPDLTAGGEPCVTLGVSGSQLEFIRARVCGAVFDVLHTTGVEVHPQHKPWVPHITLVYTEDADLSYFTDRTGPVTFDAVRLAFGGEVYDIPLGDNVVDEIVSENTSEMYELEFTASGEPIVPNVLFDWRAFQKERDVNIPGGPGHNLRNYWVRGKGAAKIRWNTPGDWTRCVAQLGKYVKDPKGLCAEYHKQATGMYTGDKRHRRMNADANVIVAKFNPNQPRDSDGQWTYGGLDTDKLSELIKFAENAWDEVAKSRTPHPSEQEHQLPSPDVKAFSKKLRKAASGRKVARVTSNVSDHAKNDRLYEAAATYYQGDSDKINYPLRRGEDLVGRDKVAVDKLDELIAKSPTRDDVKVYRSFAFPEQMFGDRWNAQDSNVGLTWDDFGFVSTSADESVAKKLILGRTKAGTSRVLAEILVPKGVNGVTVDVGPWTDEKEFLLGRNNRFRVVRDDGIDKSGMRRLVIEVIPK